MSELRYRSSVPRTSKGYVAAAPRALGRGIL